MYLPVFIIQSFFLRFFLFFKHWYYDGFFFSIRKIISILTFFDSFFALKITALNLFQPLFQDYSIIGRLISFPFRIILLFSGFLLYITIISCAIFLFLLWSSFPLLIILKSLEIIFPTLNILNLENYGI
ncbi:MAG: hypothetical protein PHZ25_00235 [Candidatus Pacebacteria bacterium]|nr:hypothetical protein [Candidatus Paceibacterota bacterium]